MNPEDFEDSSIVLKFHVSQESIKFPKTYPVDLPVECVINPPYY
ncbi:MULTISPECIES: hypothetical protein [Moorena]|uniref:Uncharacterized protein n=2 Tax=Moorena producens TaxID=1155739 RepID=A0A9Q9STL7_MOOP1|nr:MULTISPECIES: hypothetical protein [Moorena]EGJ31476.1 hypothetical protein LYNGBM3L_39640 [Moorena producens 3L]WAN69429.1 hypothetical protein BJP36_35655 [Moorena producens JHB]